MNKLTIEQRARILHHLCEGMSIRTTTRLTGASKNTVVKLLVDAGKACMAYHDANVVNVKARRIQVDGSWSFVYAKQNKVSTANAAPEGAGDTWTWTAIEVGTKLIVSYSVGGRDSECAMWFLEDLRGRLANLVQITSDGHKAYLEAVAGDLSADMDYAVLVKLYGAASENVKSRYSPAECAGVRKERIKGNPRVSTSYAERQNLAMRLHMCRFTCLTSAFSKKVENHTYAVALHMMYYNFARIHSKLCVSPAMAAGVSKRPWKIGDIVALVEATEVKIPRHCGIYQGRVDKGEV